MQSYGYLEWFKIPKSRYFSLFLTFISLFGLTARSQTTDYELLERRLGQFFSHAEWTNAAVTAERMIRVKPDITDTYATGIVAAGMAGEHNLQMQLAHTAMQNEIVVDSLFNSVRARSFDIGHTDLYEQFILDLTERYPWMSRMAGVRLLSYYDYRNNGPMMCRRALALLQASPNDTNMLAILARGYLLQGMTDEALSVYRHILTINPSDITSLLYLGNYYADRALSDNIPDDTRTDSRERAIDYLSQAGKLAPAPYITERLRSLQTPDTPTHQ